MINLDAIVAWGETHPWPTLEQIEQDLLLSRAICEITAHDYLGKELAFRGGTALNKLYSHEAHRYSEDLDFVRTTAGGISPLTTALRDMGERLGFSVTTKITRQPKVYWKTKASNGIPLKIKIEVNTRERESAMSMVKRSLSVDSRWWSGTAQVQTFALPELIASKLRALYQRSKGRDLFDIWLALEQLGVSPDEVLAAFPLYRPESYSSQQAIDNLDAKLVSRTFRIDLDALTNNIPKGYDIDSAAELIKEVLLSRV